METEELRPESGFLAAEGGASGVWGRLAGLWRGQSPADARRHNRIAFYVLAASVVALWGASFPITKIVLDVLGPMSIAFVRWTISAVALGGWLAAARRLPLAARLLRREGRTVVWVALTGITLFYALENLSLRYTTATNAGILANLTSVFLALMGALWLRERLGWRDWTAMLVAFAGAALVSAGAGHFSISGAGLAGDLMMVVATFFAALFSIGSKRLSARYPSDVITAVVATVGALFLLPLALWEGFTLALPLAAWGALLLLGLGAGALANLFWIYILARTSASRAGVILFLIPVTSTLLAVVLLHEPLTLTMGLGGLLVLLSVAAVQSDMDSEREAPRHESAHDHP